MTARATAAPRSVGKAGAKEPMMRDEPQASNNGEEFSTSRKATRQDGGGASVYFHFIILFLNSHIFYMQGGMRAEMGQERQEKWPRRGSSPGAGMAGDGGRQTMKGMSDQRAARWKRRPGQGGWWTTMDRHDQAGGEQAGTRRTAEVGNEAAPLALSAAGGRTPCCSVSGQDTRYCLRCRCM